MLATRVRKGQLVRKAQPDRLVRQVLLALLAPQGPEGPPGVLTGAFCCNCGYAEYADFHEAGVALKRVQ